MVDNNSQDYRRGTILGLTMAEAIILVVFCLLLVQNDLLSKKDEIIDSLKTKETELSNLIVELRQDSKITENIKELLEQSGRNSFDDAFNELKLIKKKQLALSKELKALTDERKLLGKIKNLKQSYPEKTIEDIQDSLELMVTIESFYDLSEEEFNTKKLSNTLVKLKREKENVQGQLKYLQKKLKKSGKGTEKPSCWATSDGKPEYIFQAVLTSNGIVLHKNTIPHRESDFIKLPTNQISYSNELSLNEYRLSTRLLYEWSVEQRCRFFVKVFDYTGKSEKKLYKKHLRVLGEHFYYYEPLSEIPEQLTADL